MTCAPCLDASWAASSCFWIIDSLSPVQVACSSAPRTILGMSVLVPDGVSSGMSVHRVGRCHEGDRSNGGRAEGRGDCWVDDRREPDAAFGTPEPGGIGTPT